MHSQLTHFVDIAWSNTLRTEHRLRVFENRVLKRIFVPKRVKRREAGEDCIMRRFINRMLHKILLVDKINEDEVGGA
jgi:hypothetical protein